MVTTNDIACFLGLNLNGECFVINGFSQISNIEEGTLVFAKKFKEEFVDLLNKHSNILAIVTLEYVGKIKCAYIVSDNPRLDFIKTLSVFFNPTNGNGKVHPSAIIEDGAQIGEHVTIESNCHISSKAIIGSKTVIHPNVTIYNEVTIGENCEIKSGAVIGQDGFGFERDKDGTPIHFPHYGKVILGNNVYIGANTCIDRGTLGDTIIEDNAKIDNLVHIAHNCHIGNGSFIIASAILGGGTQIGRNCWVAPNVSIKEQTVINDKVLIGLGAVVLKEVPEGKIMVGNPAKELVKK